MPVMTLQSRWTLSLSAILVLFGTNCGVYLWGNARRSESLLELKVALETKDLLLETRNALGDRQREAEILEPLLRSGATRLDPEQLQAIETRLRPLDELVGELAATPGMTGSGELRESYRRLRLSWMTLFGGRVEDSPAVTETGTALELEAEFEDTRHQVEVLFDRASARVERAEESFTSVAARTDRATWSIFTLSLILSTGIAIAAYRFLRVTLGRYVSPQVASSLLSSPGRLQMGGQRYRVTVLMADLRGFSGLADRLAPETVMQMINTYLAVMTEVILDHGGTIDEFIGDAILVFFGAPTPTEDHARTGVACAIRMQLAMEEVNRRNRELELPELEMGIGINTGEVVVGNVGSKRRAKFGAVGRHVNLAARIQSSTVGGQILISDRTALEAGWDLKIRDGLKISPKGFSKPVGLLDVQGIGGELGAELPDADEELRELAAPVPVEVSLMTEGGPVATWSGELVALSPQRAELRSDRPISILTQLSIRLPGTGDDDPGSELYAKVVNTGTEAGRGLLVRFTSVSPESEKTLERLATAEA